MFEKTEKYLELTRKIDCGERSDQHGLTSRNQRTSRTDRTAAATVKYQNQNTSIVCCQKMLVKFFLDCYFYT